ncbi:hypothetical protein [uncultured Shewanella sp.]|uniref:hypothetical protein n=1 Tax=uncultured Shewanella sp. TaxID=173975 RepID=UPI00262795EF|nr:hypothetical protein [uncultured Shewanella sp.]
MDDQNSPLLEREQLNAPLKQQRSQQVEYDLSSVFLDPKEVSICPYMSVNQ